MKEKLFGIRFKDRKEAGEHLAQKLRSYKGEDVLVLGIPRGGVEVAYYVAHELQAELSVIVAKKLTDPQNPEYALGAMAEETVTYIDPELNFPPSFLTSISDEVRNEIKRRIQLYRQGEPLPSMHNKTVILVDDGIATGATLAAGLEVCKRQGAKKIIIAAPVAGSDFVRELYGADELLFLQRPEIFHAVGQVYESFPQLTDEEVINYLAKAEHEQHP